MVECCQLVLTFVVIIIRIRISSSKNNKKEVYGCPNLTNVGLYAEAQIRTVIQCNVEYDRVGLCPFFVYCVDRSFNPYNGKLMNLQTFMEILFPQNTFQ